MFHQTDRDGVVVLRLEHGKVNALDVELLEGLGAHMDELERSGAKAVVLTGTGSAFCAGVNLFRMLQEGESYLRRFLPALTKGVRRLFTFPRPVVAALNGHAIAGGCVIAAAADQILMAAGSGKIGVTELLVGVPFPAAPFEVMRYRLPAPVLQRMVLTGQTLLPEEALASGVVDAVVPGEELLDRAVETARRLAGVPATTFALTKQQLRGGALARMDQGDEPGTDALWGSPEIHANIRAYLERTVGKK